MNATYYVTGAGSSVVENLRVKGATLMTTVYHLDGVDLRMTHFCAAQNQPRLKATRIDDAKGAVEFSLLDITNLQSPGAPHVEGFTIRFVDAEQIALAFTFVSGRERSYERIELRRLSPKQVGQTVRPPEDDSVRLFPLRTTRRGNQVGGAHHVVLAPRFALPRTVGVRSAATDANTCFIKN